MNRLLAWTPAAMLSLAAVFTVGIDGQRSVSLSEPLAAAVPAGLLGFEGRDLVLPEAEVRVAGASSYLLREFARPDSAGPAFSVYVGYYERQLQGTTIHSPKNCLPGSGWNALEAGTLTIATPSGPVTVNRYTVQSDDAQALVLYWYQGRGRVEHNEYAVKWDLVRDAVTRRRTDEALVRIVVPVRSDVDTAVSLARRVAEQIIPPLSGVLPT